MRSVGAAGTLSATAAVALALAATHLLVANLRFLAGIPRSRWLSAAGGISVAYVFVHVLPELGARQKAFAPSGIGALSFAEKHVYLIGLAGLTVFYGLERLVRRANRAAAVPPGIFWIHIGSFAAYNLLFGYLLLDREVPGPRSLALYGFAIGMHFVVTDYGLLEDHRQSYNAVARWVLAAALAAGWAIGTQVRIGPASTAALFSFLAGGIVLNVLKEELPEERESRFSAFLLGAAAYSALLLATAP